MARKARIHNNRIDDKVRHVLCSNFALKGVQLKSGKFSALEISVIFCLYGQDYVWASIVNKFVMRSTKAIYAILMRMCDRGIIEKNGDKQLYRLTLKGMDVYECYNTQYRVMGDNLDNLESLRIARIKD